MQEGFPRTSEEMLAKIEEKEDQDLRQLFILSQDLPNGKLKRIASDAIALYDEHDMPQKISLLTRESREALSDQRLLKIGISGDVPKGWPTKAPKPVKLDMQNYEDAGLEMLLSLHSGKARPGIQKIFRAILEEDLSIDFQKKMLKDVENIDEAELEHLAKVLRETPYSFILEAYLVNADKPEARKAILKIAEEEEHFLADIFPAYLNAIDAASSVHEYVKQHYRGSVKDAEATARAASSRITELADDFLLTVAYNPDSLSYEDLEGAYYKLSAQTVLLPAVFRALYENNPDFDMHEFTNLNLEILSGKTLKDRADDVRAELLYRRNYEKYPKEFQGALMEKFRASLENDHARFYMLYEGERGYIISFCRFEDIDDNTVYFGAFNSSDSYKGGLLGVALLNEATKLEAASGKTIEADCIPDAPITKRYLEMGFKEVGRKKLAGVEVMHIVLEPAAKAAVEKKAA